MIIGDLVWKIAQICIYSEKILRLIYPGSRGTCTWLVVGFFIWIGLRSRINLSNQNLFLVVCRPISMQCTYLYLHHEGWKVGGSEPGFKARAHEGENMEIQKDLHGQYILMPWRKTYASNFVLFCMSILLIVFTRRRKIFYFLKIYF